MTTQLRTLIGKLSPTCREAAEAAANLTSRQGHFEVEPEHLFLSLLDRSNCDFTLLAQQAGLRLEKLSTDLQQQLNLFRTGNSRTPVFSASLANLFEHAWLIASLESPRARIRSGHLLNALLTDHNLHQLAERTSPEFSTFKIASIKHDMEKLTAASIESVPVTSPEFPEEPDALTNGPTGSADTPALEQYTADLTQQAMDGKIDPIIGREPEIRQLIDILLRRRQNNPILTGEAGVGKTAVVEGLALRIAQGDVPPNLHNCRLCALDLGLLQAGASVKGEFENRLKSVISEVKASTRPIILFIDEAHTIIGAGGQAGQGDAANLLKPALARGELRTIAATTWAEYKRYFEKDAALARRFQVVNVPEPDEALAADMLRAITPLLEAHFNIRIRDAAVQEAVRLSARYINGRQLPDKAVSVLDTACAKVAMSQFGIPAVMEDIHEQLVRITRKIDAIKADHEGESFEDARIEALEIKKSELVDQLDNSQKQVDEQRRLVNEIRQLRADKAEWQTIAVKVAELEQIQDQANLVPMEVDAQTIASVVAAWTGIPLGRMLQDELDHVLNLETQLQKRVLGQRDATAAIAQRIRIARAGLGDPDKPQGVFLFAGPSGVGKTETARALADVLYGGEHNLITINMSEYQEAHSVSGLKGSPPGYVGYGEGGVLTEAVRRNPYSVVLLDEIEKAHEDVRELFYQIFDRGSVEDAEGSFIDFRHCIIILTSNIGSVKIMHSCLNKADSDFPRAGELEDIIKEDLHRAFKPAFLGRLKCVPFYPLNDRQLNSIIQLKLSHIEQRYFEEHRRKLHFSNKVAETILNRCTEVDSGARNIDHIISASLLPEISERLLTRMTQGNPVTDAKIGVHRSGSFTVKLSPE